MVQSKRKAAEVCPSDPPFVKNLGRSDFAKSQLVAISAEPGAPQATVRKPTQGLTSRKSSWASPPRERGTDHRPQSTVYHVVGFSSTQKSKKNFIDNIAPCIRG